MPFVLNKGANYDFITKNTNYLIIYGKLAGFFKIMSNIYKYGLLNFKITATILHNLLLIII